MIERIKDEELKLGRTEYKSLKYKNKIFAKRLLDMKMQKRSEKILYCAEVMRYQIYWQDGIKKKLAAVHFCKDMFCPICMKKRSIENGMKLQRMCEKLKEKGYGFLGLTLTLKNDFDAEEMREKIWRSWRDLRRRKVMEFMNGAFASLEVTFSKDTGYHFHLHVLLATKLKLPLDRASYRFISDNISLNWLQITGDSFITKLTGVKNYKQFSKYVTKMEDVLSMDDEALKGLMKSMYGKKTYTKTGVFRDVDIDVDKLDDKDIDDEEFICFEVYRWNNELNVYERKFEDKDFNEIDMQEVILRMREVKKRKGKKGG